MAMILSFRARQRPKYVLKARCRRLLGCRSGQAIVEFALVAPILLGLLCGIIEFSSIILVQTLLEGGARQASRYGITGVVPDGISRQTMILQIIGENSFDIIDPDNIDVETQVYRTFGEIGQPEPFTDDNGNGSYDSGEPFEDINANGGWDGDMGAAGLGGPGEVVVYQLSYDWPIMVPIFRPIFGDEVTVEASIAVRNEPSGG
ncbi:MAG: TadE/TadG family type IV pilus assembly protein [Geminicoccaceae bacterium]